MAFLIAFATGSAIFNILCINLMDYVAISWHPALFFALLTALVFLPFIGLLYGGIKLLFGINTRIRIGLILFLLWLAALFTFVGMSISHTTSFFHWRTVHEYVELPAIKNDTLFVDIAQEYYTEGELEPVMESIDHWGFHHKKKHDKLKINKQ
jgi:hypothetical protein